jgi:MarR family transcriptional regulator, 2-MHQ and catechol-resistance regulon repressor
MRFVIFSSTSNDLMWRKKMPTHYDGTPEERLALDTFIKLNRAMISFEARMLARGQLGSLTMSQFGVLEALFHLGPMCQGELSRKLLKSTGNMTLVLDNLEKTGLVRRIRSEEDRRMVRIELTQAGAERIAEVLPHARRRDPRRDGGAQPARTG